MILAQLTDIPRDPSALWVIAASIVIGGGLVTLAMGYAFTTVKGATQGTKSAVTEMLGFCRDESSRREIVISKICETHESVGTRIAAKVDELKTEFVRHSVRTGEKLDDMHEDIRQKPKPAVKHKPGE